MRTLRPDPSGVAVELGAEFVHGHPPEIQSLLPHPEDDLLELKDRHDVYWRGKLEPVPGLFDKLESAMKKMGELLEEDRSVMEFIQHEHLPPLESEMLRNYVEGFNAADARHLSERALASESSQATDINESSKIVAGYDLIFNRLVRELSDAGCDIRLESRLTRLRWSHGHVTADILGPNNAPHVLEARAVILTLPVSILALKEEDPQFVALDPEMPEKRSAARGMAMGPVCKLVFHFTKPLVDAGSSDILFLHSPELTFGARWVWGWAGSKWMTMWSGGTKADELSPMTAAQLAERALAELALILKEDLTALKKKVAGVYYHDWVHDPHTRGAYSYVKVGSFGAREALARPVAGTVFFAGEATMADGSSGTVHGAIRSGRRAGAELRTAIASG